MKKTKRYVLKLAIELIKTKNKNSKRAIYLKYKHKRMKEKVHSLVITKVLWPIRVDINEFCIAIFFHFQLKCNKPHLKITWKKKVDQNCIDTFLSYHICVFIWEYVWEFVWEMILMVLFWSMMYDILGRLAYSCRNLGSSPSLNRCSSHLHFRSIAVI